MQAPLNEHRWWWWDGIPTKGPDMLHTPTDQVSSIRVLSASQVTRRFGALGAAAGILIETRRGLRR
ncbi:MAG: hypothetical protein ACREM1_00040 [Longimicrobiales bacterium]